MILYAINISTGGGKVLLDELLSKQTFGTINLAYLDERYEFSFPIPAGLRIIKIKPKLLHRLIAEVRLWIEDKLHCNEEILFFGNLPPLLRMQNRTILYLQNAYLLRTTPILNDSLRHFVRYLYEIIILRTFITNIEEIWVQTYWMKKQAQKEFEMPCLIKVFYPYIEFKRNISKYEFVLHTGALKHKNFELFYKAMVESDISKNIHIAIICSGNSLKINESITNLKKKENLKVEFFTNISHEDSLKILSMSKTLMTLSYLESLSLPIYEANIFKKKIVCLDLPINKEVVNEGIFLREPYLDNLKFFLQGMNNDSTI